MTEITAVPLMLIQTMAATHTVTDSFAQTVTMVHHVQQLVCV